MKTLNSQRLILRSFKETDLNDFYYYAKNPNIGPKAGWKPHDSIEETKTILMMFIRKQEVWAIYHKKHKKVIGSVGLHKKSIHNKLELGYVLSEDYWGQGLMVESCKLVIKYAFEENNISKIEVVHFKENAQSNRVIEKLGIRYEGIKKEGFKMYNKVIHECVKYSMSRSDYEKRKDDFNAKT